MGRQDLNGQNPEALLVEAAAAAVMRVSGPGRASAQRAWALADVGAGGRERLDLGLGGAFAAGDDRAGVAHAAAGRGGAAGDERDHRLASRSALM